MTPNEKIRLERLEGILAKIIKSDRYTINRLLEILDGRDIQVGTGTGTKIGTTTTQKISVFGVVPIVQAGAITAPTGGATVDTQSRTAISLIITALKNFGITA